MPPVAAVSLVFALVLGAVLWIYVLRLSFAQSVLSGIIAILLPPVALLNILAHRRDDRELVALTGTVILLTCAALATS